LLNASPVCGHFAGININPNYSTFKRGLDMDVYIKNQYGDPYVAQVWPGPVHFPDFLHPDIQEYWGTEIDLFHKKIPFDGLWLDMNEASNFCRGPSCYVDPDSTCPLEDFIVCCLVCNTSHSLSAWDDPPYKINCSYGAVFGKTIALSAKHYGEVKEYDAHNLYGLSEVIITSKTLTNITEKRPFILSRSTFVGSGAYAAHWTGDNQATWADLAYSIVSVLNSGIVGIPMVGADICGFQSDTWEELCNRWIQVGAFYPFARDHSERTTIRQELYLWDSVAQSARDFLGIRYQLLPYYYTLLFEAHTTGAPVLRPLFFEFADDRVSFEINAQFMVGNSILVSPVLASAETTVKAYFPKGEWYNLLDVAQVFCFLQL
jgi:alpha-D-xyloside xylohydrolase